MGRAWWPEEEDALRAAVQRYGVGAWEAMRKDPEFKDLLSYRSGMQLKDKWRNLIKFGHLQFSEILSAPKKAITRPMGAEDGAEETVAQTRAAGSGKAAPRTAAAAAAAGAAAAIAAGRPVITGGAPRRRRDRSSGSTHHMPLPPLDISMNATNNNNNNNVSSPPVSETSLSAMVQPNTDFLPPRRRQPRSARPDAAARAAAAKAALSMGIPPPIGGASSGQQAAQQRMSSRGHGKAPKCFGEWSDGCDDNRSSEEYTDDGGNQQSDDAVDSSALAGLDMNMFIEGNMTEKQIREQYGGAAALAVAAHIKRIAEGKGPLPPPVKRRVSGKRKSRARPMEVPTKFKRGKRTPGLRSPRTTEWVLRATDEEGRLEGVEVGPLFVGSIAPPSPVPGNRRRRCSSSSASPCGSPIKISRRRMDDSSIDSIHSYDDDDGDELAPVAPGAVDGGAQLVEPSGANMHSGSMQAQMFSPTPTGYDCFLAECLGVSHMPVGPGVVPVHMDTDGYSGDDGDDDSSVLETMVGGLGLNLDQHGLSMYDMHSLPLGSGITLQNATLGYEDDMGARLYASAFANNANVSHAVC